MNASLTRTLVTLALSIAFAFAAVAAPEKGKTYATPEKAVDAFVASFRDYNPKALLSIFGKGSEPLWKSDDEVADKNTRTIFLSLYDTKHALTDREDGAKILVVGTDNWPMPIPLVKSGGRWYFDTAQGFEEVINRRIGRNELHTIQTCLAIGDAQRDYFAVDRNGDGILEYAKKFASTVGLRDGLFWPAQQGEPPSPLGLLVATAADEGYTRASGSYHGYHYKLLTSQGPSAPGGAYDYMAHGHQIGGYAILAYPANYGETGIMTFILSHSGTVYQRDLGKESEAEALKITTFDPGQGWTPVPDKDLQPVPVD